MIDKKAEAEKIGRYVVNRITAEAILETDRHLTKEAAQRHSSDVQSGQLSALAFLGELEKIAAAEEAGQSYEYYKRTNPVELDDLV